MQFIEILGALMGILSVILAGRKDPRTWIIGAVSSALLLVIFYTTKDYGLMYLQVGYIIISLVGYFKWTKFKGSSSLWFIPLILLTYIQGNDIVDFFAIMFALAATYFLIEKMRIAWPLYIISNILSLVVCWYSGLYFLYIQYLIFIILSINGYLQWKQD